MSAPIRLDLRDAPPDAPDPAPAVDHLRGGGLLAYPTETVYGFGGPSTLEGIARLRGLKPRSAERPFLVLVSGVDQVTGLAWPRGAVELAGIFWPGALTLVLADPSGIFPAGVRSASGSVAVRVSPHPFVRALLEAYGAPITSTSANVPGEPPARSGADAFAAAVALGAGPEVLVVDVGTLPPSGPSTIVDFTGSEPRIVREGTIPRGRLRCALPELNGR